MTNQKVAKKGFVPLSTRPEIVVLNKIDSADEETLRATVGTIQKEKTSKSYACQPLPAKT